MERRSVVGRGVLAGDLASLAHVLLDLSNANHV